MIYKLLNYLKEVDVETNSGCVKLEHEDNCYVSDVGSVLIKESKHNEIEVAILEGVGTLNKVMLTFYNPIENVNGILDSNCEISSELIGRPVQDSCLINSDWGTYCLGLFHQKGHCDFSVDDKLIHISINVSEMNDNCCHIVFDKYVPVYTNSEVVKKFLAQLS